MGIEEQPGSEELVRRIVAGDAQAEEDLILRFQPAIRAFLNARARPDLVDEVSQETMIGVICAIRAGKLREAGSLGAFVYGTAKRQLADAARKRARDTGDPLPEDYRHPSPGAEPALLVAARREIESLNETDRRIVSLTLIDGFRADEVAAALGVSAEVVRKRKSRALQKITEKLAPRSRNDAAERLNSMKGIQ